MDKESKELLLKDLCARLPYELYFKLEVDGKSTNKILTPEWIRDIKYHPQYFKPYLRPMSSMMEEEKSELRAIISDMGDKWFKDGSSNQDKWNACCFAYGECTDYLNSIYIDYRGLIPKGLALEAPEGMYKID